MKQAILATVIFALTTVSAFSQVKELSNAETFSAKSGALIQKEFLKIGSIKGANVSVIYFTDLITKTKQSALKFEYDVVGKYSTDTKSAVLDADEVDGLINSIKIIQESVFPLTATNYTEVSFKSRGGFDAGCFWSSGNWSTYLKLEKFDNKSYVFLEKDDFSVLLGLLQEAKLKL